ncbi:MAG: hypothetical protein BWZ01_01843 [Deltaproteobacteria bacterium ADurb.BinA179]|nr:MAG: hypothetical protein BWZ01_01843 [Deltaproteobacteria bacterium ADurb.BinA179]
MTTPDMPSRITLSPGLMSVDAFSSPTTAGISREWAMIEVWDVMPPTSVAKPRTFSLFSIAVSAGERSWATMTLSSRRWNFFVFFPMRFLRSRSPTKVVSATRLLIYSSPMDSKFLSISCKAILSAHSALMCSVAMSSLTLPVRDGSVSIIRWVSRMKECSLPTLWSSSSRIASLICFSDARTASLKRLISSAMREAVMRILG